MTYEWKPEYEATLDTLITTDQAEDVGLHGRLPKEIAESHRKLVTTSTDILALQLVYIAGFNDISSEGALAGKVAPPVRDWVMAAKERSPWTLSGLVSTTECAILERFIKEVAVLHIDTATVDRVRPSFTGNRKLPKDDANAAAHLARYMKPSAMSANTNWVTDLDTILGCKLDPAVAGSLVSMIVFRNGFIHDPMDDDLLKGRWDEPVTGEQIKCWALSVMLCARAILATKYP